MTDRIEMTALAQDLAAHLVSLHYDALPSDAIAAAKKIMLDTLAVAWAGIDAHGAPAALAVACEQGGTPHSTIWGHGVKLPVMSAAFANGVFAAALDFDSHYLGVHADGVVLPAALAIAEQRAASGRQFLTALAAANDIVCRLGKGAQGVHRGWYYTAIFGIAGAAAASAKLLQLDVTATRHALAIALAQAAGTQQPAVEHTLTMRFHAGFAARSGVLGALLAAKGVTGPSQAFEGKFGLFSLYQPGSAGPLLTDLGRTYHNAQMALKKYPCCACSHAAIEAACQLMAVHKLAAEDIAQVVVHISADMDRLVGERSAPAADAGVAAQFSVRYAVACALMFGGFSVRHLRHDVLSSSALRAFMDRMRVVVDPALSGKFAPAEVEIIPHQGRAVRCRVDSMPGTPDAPMSENERNDKLAACFSASVKPLDARRRQLLEDRVSRLEMHPAMNTFFDGVVNAGP